MKLHKYIKDFDKYFLRFFFKFPLTITITSYLRFIYFYYVKRNFKVLYNNENLPDHIGKSKLHGDNAIEHNIDYIKSLFNFKKIYNKFNGKRTDIPIYPLRALYNLKFSEMNVLSIGPRVESEIFKLISLGFDYKKIKSIDIQTYSNLIKLGDMINIPFKDDSFDLIVVGWVLTYTNNPKKCIEEIIRVSKKGCLVSMCHSHSKNKNQVYSSEDLNSSEKIISFFNQNSNKVIFNYHPFDDDFNGDLYGKSNLLIQITK